MVEKSNKKKGSKEPDRYAFLTMTDGIIKKDDRYYRKIGEVQEQPIMPEMLEQFRTRFVIAKFLGNIHESGLPMKKELMDIVKLVPDEFKNTKASEYFTLELFIDKFKIVEVRYDADEETGIVPESKYFVPFSYDLIEDGEIKTISENELVTLKFVQDLRKRYILNHRLFEGLISIADKKDR